MKCPTILVLLFLCTFHCPDTILAQNVTQPCKTEPVALTGEQLFTLETLPPLTVPENYKGNDAPLLPSWIDNSVQPYFRPITYQLGFECGQSAGIAYNFTYEIDRLRNVPADTTAYQYPTHFAWDFLNNGDNYTGASCFDSWEILRACGTMNVADYGGDLWTGGYLRWITGYDKYYNGMSNRINYMRSIRVDTPEGLQALKYWLYDHLEGSPVGGLANLYGKYFHPTMVLDSGTTEGGKNVVTSWPYGATHTYTVVGFNDSIRYDYNHDGKYTNDVDINADGKVDMHDWEVGAIKIASGYEGTSWSNDGFIYSMYKCLADNMGEGGIWNHSVYVIDVKDTCVPQLTAKVTLKHPSRNKLRVTMGITNDLQSPTPLYVQDYPVFNFQGGDHPMQGEASEAAKTIEFGLDLTPLINQLENDQQVKIFLQVEESDTGNVYNGEILQYSLMDYSSGSPVEIASSSPPVEIINDSVTRLGIVYSMNIPRPQISTSELPSATLYQPYSYQLDASGGTSPYLWDVSLNYPETVANSIFPVISDVQLQPTNYNDGYAVLDLPFSFPFYKRFVNKLYICADGYILFDDQPFWWPYLIDRKLMFKSTSVISPLMTDLYLYPTQSEGMWTSQDSVSVSIRWKASINGMPDSSSLNFAVKLYRDGKIEFYYGDMTCPSNVNWIGGISGGDNKNFQFSQFTGLSKVPSRKIDVFDPCGFPPEMSISETGLFSGIPLHPYGNSPVSFLVTDNNNITTSKSIYFSAVGLQVISSFHPGTDTIIQYGDSVYMDISLTNEGIFTIHNIQALLSGGSPFLNLNDSIEIIGNLLPGESITLDNAYSMYVSPTVSDQVNIPSTLNVTSDEYSFKRSPGFIVAAPEIILSEIDIEDGDNQRLDPGETTDVRIKIRNTGHASAAIFNPMLSSLDTLLVINSFSGSPVTLRPDSAFMFMCNVTAAGQAPFQHLYSMLCNMQGPSGFTKTDTAYLFSGEIAEDFETGNLKKFDWFIGGNGLFHADSLEHYEGKFAARSGVIAENMESTLSLELKVLQNGTLGFYKKVSCELDSSGSVNFDHLAFFMDDNEMGRWDGSVGWSRENYPVSPGVHTFKWVYHKDNSISSGSDCAWLDFITLPPFDKGIPEIRVTPLSLEINLDKGTVSEDTILISNAGGGILRYSGVIFDTSSHLIEADRLKNQCGGANLVCNTTTFDPGQPFDWNFTVTNHFTDSTYIRQIDFDYPDGFTISSATDFKGGINGDLVFQGVQGNENRLRWTGSTPGGSGIIEPGGTASATISGYIDKTFSKNIYFIYSVSGDTAGGISSRFSSDIMLLNNGLPNSWLSLTPGKGNLLHDDSDSIIVRFDAHAIASGKHACKIIFNDGFNNILIVAARMTVKDTSTNNNIIHNFHGGIPVAGYPNPFKTVVNIEYELKKQDFARVCISDMLGKNIKSLLSEIQPAGIHKLSWNGEDESGCKVPPGIYDCSVHTNGGIGMVKLVLLR